MKTSSERSIFLSLILCIIDEHAPREKTIQWLKDSRQNNDRGSTVQMLTYMQQISRRQHLWLRSNYIFGGKTSKHVWVKVHLNQMCISRDITVIRFSSFFLGQTCSNQMVSLYSMQIFQALMHSSARDCVCLKANDPYLPFFYRRHLVSPIAKRFLMYFNDGI